MRKLLLTGLSAILMLSMTACSSGTPKEKVFIEENEIGNLYTSPKDYKNKYVTLTGKVFGNPESKDDLVVFQMFNDPKNSDRNTIVICDSNTNGIKSDNYVKVTGYIEGAFEGENLFGASVTAPQIRAESVEVVSYIDAVSPTLKSVEINQTKESNSNGVTITLEKVEFAETETRLYLSVDNQSNSKYMFYSFNTKIVQDNKQYEEEMNYDANYPEFASEIPSGVKEEGVIAFPAINQNDFKLLSEGYSDDYNIDRDTFTFEVKVQ